MTRPFRFGLGKLEIPDADAWLKSSRQVEEQGYDILLVPDHLGKTAPFPPLVATAAVTGLRVGTLVLNTGFYHPPLLARDAATTDRLTGGRLELGLGTGYVHEEFQALGLDPGTPKDRVDQLEHTVNQLTAIFADPAAEPVPVQRPMPLLIAGNGNRVLRLAAEHADIVGFIGMRYDPTSPGGLRLISTEEFTDRVAYFEQVAAASSAELERNLLIQAVVVTDDRDAAIRYIQQTQLPIPLEELERSPLLLIGSVEQIIAQVHEIRERYGISYLTVMDAHQEAFAPVVQALAGK
ncbi:MULTISPECIES: TIGR03621 family F420-dependent LLM class oxidoreductase [unclassified Nonomuraea]|uniref:TIGR03621 family F420-dependent LLM class oxidoreductase n=1 Tax=unclassified Nonomuraea TaxID=2593643 RepID=UPI0033FE27CA